MLDAQPTCWPAVAVCLATGPSHSSISSRSHPDNPSDLGGDGEVSSTVGLSLRTLFVLAVSGLVLPRPILFTLSGSRAASRWSQSPTTVDPN